MIIRHILRRSRGRLTCGLVFLSALLFGETALLAQTVQASSTPTGAAADATATPADAVRLIVSGSISAPIEKLRPELERKLGHPITLRVGSARGTLKTEIMDGRGFEVAILLPDVTDELLAAGKTTAEYVDVAHVNIGIGVRGDVPPIDVSTPAALKAAILGAKALEWSPNGVALDTVNKILDTLDIRARTTATWHPSRQPTLVPLRPGEYELQIFPISEILESRVARYLGPVIPELHVPQVMRAVISADTPDRRSAEAIISFLQSPEFISALTASGMTR